MSRFPSENEDIDEMRELNYIQCKNERNIQECKIQNKLLSEIRANITAIKESVNAMEAKQRTHTSVWQGGYRDNSKKE